MRRIRVIPSLLIDKEALVKSKRFKKAQYVGDPINAVKVFNDKEVDELCILDISCTRDSRAPDFAFIRDLSGEAFMPLSYGGGITTIDQAEQLLTAGVEKVILNTSAHKKMDLITEISKRFGSQSVVVSIDIRKDWRGKHKVYHSGGRVKSRHSAVSFAQQVVDAGAGEIICTSIEREGTYMGYDLPLISSITSAVTVPVVAHGGCGSVDDMAEAIIDAGASAVAAGSMFVFQRPHNAVLITYPSQEELKEKLFNRL